MNCRTHRRESVVGPEARGSRVPHNLFAATLVVGTWLLMACTGKNSPEARVLRAMRLGLQIGDSIDRSDPVLTNLTFVPQVGYSAEINDQKLLVASVTALARVSEDPPSRSPTLLGVQAIGRKEGADRLAAELQRLATEAYGHGPSIGCAKAIDSMDRVLFWRSTFGGVWMLIPLAAPGERSWRPVRIFINGPFLRQFSAPRFVEQPCPT